MNKLLIVGSTVMLGFVVAGCNKAENPAEVRHNVAMAQDDRSKDVADARNKQADNIVAKQQEVNEATDKGNYQVALAQAEGNYKVAKESCEALSGNSQVHCKDRAETNYKSAKDSAEQLKQKS